MLDGTTCLGKAFAIVLRFVSDTCSWTLEQRLVRVQLLAKTLAGVSRKIWTRQKATFVPQNWPAHAKTRPVYFCLPKLDPVHFLLTKAGPSPFFSSQGWTRSTFCLPKLDWIQYFLPKLPKVDPVHFLLAKAGSCPHFFVSIQLGQQFIHLTRPVPLWLTKWKLITVCF